MRYGTLLFYIVASFALLGCRSNGGFVVEDLRQTVIHDTIREYRTDIQRDTCIVKDSVMVYAIGDTIVTYKYRYQDRIKYVGKTDTLYISKTDTVTVKQKEVKYEHKLYGWQKTILWIAAGIIILFAMIIVIWLVKRR